MRKGLVGVALLSLIVAGMATLPGGWQGPVGTAAAQSPDIHCEPIAHFTVTPDPVPLGDPVTFDFSGSSLAFNNAWTFQYDVNDTLAPIVAGQGSDFSAVNPHIYPTTGIKRPTLSIDPEFCAGAETSVFTVEVLVAVPIDLTVDTDLGAPTGVDPACTTAPGDCSLHDAIGVANSLPGFDAIRFAIGPSGGTISATEQTIDLLTPLPAIMEPVMFDGASQFGFDPGDGGGALIVLTTSVPGPGEFIGLDFNASASDSFVYNLHFDGLRGAIRADGALHVQTSAFSDNCRTIGTCIPDPGDMQARERANRGGAIYISDQNAGEVVLDANTFTNNQASHGGAVGLQGGSLFLTQNVFDGNTAVGGAGGALAIDSGYVDSEQFGFGNSFYNNAAWWGGAIAINDEMGIGLPLPTGLLCCSDSFQDNVATFHGGAISIRARGFGEIAGAEFLRNAAPLGGTFYVETSDVRIGGNKIVDSGADAIVVAGADSKRVRLDDNSITNSAGLAINLVGGDEDAFNVTANDVGDGDDGLQNFPELQGAWLGANDVLTVHGSLDSLPGEYEIEIRGVDECDPSGHGEGFQRLHFTGLTIDEANPAGLFNSSAQVGFESALVGSWVAALAHGPNGTSEYSACVQVQPGPAPPSPQATQQGPPEPEPEPEVMEPVPPKTDLVGGCFDWSGGPCAIGNPNGGSTTTTETTSETNTQTTTDTETSDSTTTSTATDAPPGPSGGDDLAGQSFGAEAFRPARLAFLSAGSRIDPGSGVSGVVTTLFDPGTSLIPASTVCVDVFDRDGGLVAHAPAGGDLDLSGLPNEWYTAEAFRCPPPEADGMQPQQSRVVYARETVLVMNPQAEPGPTAGAVATGVGVVGAAGLIANTILSRGALFIGEGTREALIAVGEDRLRHAPGPRLRSATERRAARRRAIGAFAGAVALLGVFFALEGASSWALSDILSVLPVIGACALYFFAGQYGLEYLASRMSGATARFKFLWSGAASLVVSTLVFRVAFGYPGYIDEDDSPHAKPHVLGFRALGVYGAMLALCVPFVALGRFVDYDFFAAGMTVAVVALSTATIPVKPLPGGDVWTWKPLVSLAAMLGAMTLFFGFQLALIAPAVYVGLGVAGALFYIGTLRWLSLRRRAALPGWYASARARSHRLRAAVEEAKPAWVKRFREARHSFYGRVRHGVGSALDEAVFRAANAWRRMRRLPPLVRGPSL